MSETAAPSPDSSPLRIANFRAYWFSRLSMTLAQYAMMLIIGWQTYNIARDSGLGVLVGCMVGGSLSMAPAVLLAGLADAADLDGPLWLAEDIAHGLTYTDGQISPPERALWG